MRRLDPSRIIYHHSSGNLGSMHTINFYPNFVPVQELSDWFEHWATRRRQAGLSPSNTAPHSPGTGPCTGAGIAANASSAAHRFPGNSAWRNGMRSFSATGRIGSANRKRQTCGGRRSSFERAGCGIAGTIPSKLDRRSWRSGIRFLPVHHRQLACLPHLGRLGKFPLGTRALLETSRGLNRQRENLDVDWDDLQRPGFSPDYVDDRYERWIWRTIGRIGLSRRPLKRCSGTISRCWHTSPASLRNSPAKTTIFSGRDGRETAHRHQ